MTLATPTDAAPERGVIQQDGEVVLREPFIGMIHCDRLVLEAGAAVNAEIRVDELELKAGAKLTGPVDALRVRIHDGAELTGELRAERLTVKGRVVGIVIAGLVQAARTASFQGFVIAESYGSEIGAEVRGSMRASVGQTAQIAHIDRDRERVVQGGVVSREDVWSTTSRPYMAPEAPERSAPAQPAALSPASTDVKIEPAAPIHVSAAAPVAFAPRPEIASAVRLVDPERRPSPQPVFNAPPSRADEYRPRLI